ncbi:hypothetical protein V6N11_043689 [Hibiscus sabdariffa]|uniref:Uncharacterized protein n=1 Tax=Hibiscus sabdariffa TaxID=183260 RepID=A0ABR2RDF0_9ROSI
MWNISRAMPDTSATSHAVAVNLRTHLMLSSVQENVFAFFNLIKFSISKLHIRWNALLPQISIALGENTSPVESSTTRIGLDLRCQTSLMNLIAGFSMSNRSPTVYHGIVLFFFAKLPNSDLRFDSLSSFPVKETCRSR